MPSRKPTKNNPIVLNLDPKMFNDDDFDDINFSAPDKDFFSSSSDKLKAKGIYYITGPIEDDSLLDIHQDMILKTLDPKWTDDLQIIINSPGGSAPAAWSLVDLMNWTRLDIKTICMGECASAGAILLAAGTKGKRTISANAGIMIHEYAWGFGGKHSELIAAGKALKLEQEKHLNFWLQASKYTTHEDVIKYLLQPTDNYISPQEALDHGIVDIVQGSPSPLVETPSASNPPEKKKSQRKRNG